MGPAQMRKIIRRIAEMTRGPIAAGVEGRNARCLKNAKSMAVFNSRILPVLNVNATKPCETDAQGSFAILMTTVHPNTAI